MKDIIKTARIIGWGEFFRTVRYLLTDPKAREQGFYDYPASDCNLLDEMNAALRALGLPDDWAYSEEDLRRAKTSNLALTFFAINHIVGVHMSSVVLRMIEHQRQERTGAREATGIENWQEAAE